MGQTNCTLANQYSTLPICCAGGSGIFIGANNLFPGYSESSSVLMSIVYLILLLWLFMGVAMAADVFMAAIETITSTVSIVKNTMPGNFRLPASAAGHARIARCAPTNEAAYAQGSPPSRPCLAPSHVPIVGGSVSPDCVICNRVCVLPLRQTAPFAASVRARGTPPWPT
jgi:hypothetical protein